MSGIAGPAHDDVLAGLAELGFDVGASAETFLDPRPSARTLVARVIERLRTDERGRDHPALAIAAQWLRHGRAREDAVATARLAAAVVRLLRDAGRAWGEAAGWVPEAADLRAVSLRGEDLRSTSLMRAILDDATLHGAELEHAVLSGARLDRTDLGACRLWNTRLDGATGTDTILEHVDADRCDLRGIRLTRPRMTLSTFTCCRWTGAALYDAEVGPTLVAGSEPPDRAPRPPRPRFTVSRASWTAARPHELWWSPDDALVTLLAWPGAVLLVDATTGNMRLGLEQPRIHDARWSPSGDALVTFGSYEVTAQVWNIRSGERRLVLEGHAGGIHDVAWSPDGRWLASVAGDGGIRLWSAADGALLHMASTDDRVHGVTWSERGDRLITRYLHGTPQVWDVTSGPSLRPRPELASLASATWSRDGERLATIDEDGALRILDAASGEPRLTLPGFSRSSMLAWSPEGERLAVVGEAPQAGVRMTIVSVRDGATVAVTSEHRGLPVGLAWSPRGHRILTVDWHYHVDSQVSLWDAADGSPRAVIPTATERARATWSSDGEMFAVTEPETPRIELRHADDGELVSALADAPRAVFGVTWTPDGRRLLTHGGGVARWWDLHRGALLGAFRSSSTLAYASPDGRWLASDDGTSVTIHDAERGTLRATVQRPAGRCARLAWSSDGRRLACRTPSQLAIWDVETEAWLEPLEQVPVPRGGERFPGPCAWSPDGRSIAMVRGASVVVMDVERRAVVLEIEPTEGPFYALAWSPDGERLAGAGHTNASPIWNVRDGSIACVLDHPLELCELLIDIAWSPHGRSLATTSVSGNVWLWNAHDGACTLELRLGGSVSHVAWSPDGTRIATNGPDVHVWDATTGARVAELHAEGDAWMVSVAGGGFQRGPARPRVMLEVEQPQGNAYLPAAGILDHPTPELVAAALGGATPVSLAEAQGWPPAEVWDGRVHRMHWVDDPDEP